MIILRWIITPFVAPIILLALVAAGWGAMSVVELNCPPEHMAGGICNASYAPGIADTIVILTGLLAGFAAPYLAAQVAPRGKRIVAAIVILVGIAVTLMYLDASYRQFTWAALAGAVAALVLIGRKQQE